MTDAFVHPVTGELLPADEDTVARAYAETAIELSRIYNARTPLLERLAELRGPAVLPKRRYQTDKQTKVDRCPRCSARIRADEAA